MSIRIMVPSQRSVTRPGIMCGSIQPSRKIVAINQMMAREYLSSKKKNNAFHTIFMFLNRNHWPLS